MANESSGRTVMVSGRIVWANGDLFQGKGKTVFGTQQPQLDQDGKQIREYGFGLAVPKADLALTAAGQPGEIWSAIYEEAYQVYPSKNLPPGFALKVKDGDGVDHQGQPMGNREGHAGCMIFALTTRLPIKFFKYDASVGNNILVTDGIKPGDHVRVQVLVKAHGVIGQGKPGMYLNPLAAQLVGYGKEIINLPSGDDIFGTQAPPVPQGASAAPLAPPPAPGFPPAAPSVPAPQMVASPQGFPVPGPQTVNAMPPQAVPQPHYGVLPQAHQPQAAPTPPPAFNPSPVAPAQPSFGGFPPPPPGV